MSSPTMGVESSKGTVGNSSSHLPWKKRRRGGGRLLVLLEILLIKVGIIIVPE